jgi:hypothetical protein
MVSCTLLLHADIWARSSQPTSLIQRIFSGVSLLPLQLSGRSSFIFFATMTYAYVQRVCTTHLFSPFYFMAMKRGLLPSPARHGSTNLLLNSLPVRGSSQCCVLGLVCPASSPRCRPPSPLLHAHHPTPPPSPPICPHTHPATRHRRRPAPALLHHLARARPRAVFAPAATASRKLGQRVMSRLQAHQGAERWSRSGAAEKGSGATVQARHCEGRRRGGNSELPLLSWLK